MEPAESGRWLRFVHFPAFSRDWARLGLDDAALRALEVAILAAPDRPAVIRGTAGLRKIRFTPPGAGRGKSGAYRICYAHFPEFGTVALVVAFGKNERDNLNAADRNAIAAAMRLYHAELGRESRRSDRSEGQR